MEISLLGEHRVATDGVVVAGLRSPRSVALLAYLVLHRGSPQSRQHLAGVFWPDSTDAQSLTNLRRELHHLRASLPPDVNHWLTVDSRTLLWQTGPDCQVDVACFDDATTRAEAARAVGDDDAFIAAANESLRWYRGELMPAFYDEWVSSERDRLHRRCVALLDDLIAVETASGLEGEAIEHAHRRVEIEPMEESGYGTLLRLQAATGHRAAAIRTYHRCVSVLEQQLGVAPDPSLTADYQRLVDQGKDPTQVDERVDDVAPRRRRIPLVGRQSELRWLRDHWDTAAAGHAGFAIMLGEAGVGKSRLVAELVSSVHRDEAIVARARCFAGRGRLALAPVSEWLRSPALRAFVDQLDPVWRSEVDRLVPPSGADGARVRPRPMADSWQRHRFVEGLARAVLVSGRPTLLVLDDLQWCDAETLTWLQLLLQLGHDSPLLVVATARFEEIDDNPELADSLQGLRSTGSVAERELLPLSQEEVAELATILEGEPLPDEDARRLHQVSAGFPLFVIEAGRARSLSGLDAELERVPRVHAVLAGRLAQPSPAAQDVASLAAVLGRDFTLELLVDASDLEADDVVGAVDELWRRRILRERSGGTYDFAHDLLRKTAYEAIGPPRRRLLHRRVAQAIELGYVDQLDTVAATLAEQYDRAGMPSRAVRYHAQAGEVATTVFANDEAIGHYRRGLKLLEQLPPGRERDQTELTIREAMTAPLNARFGYASLELQETLERTLALSRRFDDTGAQLLSLVGLFAVRYVQGHITQSYELATRSLSLSHLHPEFAGQAHFVVGGALTSLARHQEALPHFERAHSLSLNAAPALVGTRTEVHARAWCAHAMWLLGCDDDALQWSEWAVARAEETEHPYSLAVALAYAAITQQFLGDREQSLARAHQVQELCERYGFAYYREWGAILQGWCEGGAAGADRIRLGLQRLRDTGARAREPYYLALLAEVLLADGRNDDAGAVLDAAQSAALAREDVWWLAELWRLEARRQTGPKREQLLREAIAVAHQQGAVPLRQRAMTDLGSE